MKVLKLLLVAGMLSLGLSELSSGASPPKLTPEEMKKASQIFFDRCAGCHGMLRKGATGPALTPDIMRQRGLKYIKMIITNGTPGGMPDWGRQGILSKKEIELLAKFLMHEPPEPPLMSLSQMKEWWKVYVPPEARPPKPQHDLNWRNFMGVR